MKKLRNRNVFILLTIILSLGITLGAVYFMYQYKDSRENELKTGMISLNFTEKSEVINLTSNVPMIDDLGLKSRPYEFTITNTSTVPVKANITLDVDSTTTIKYGAVRYALFINDERVIKDYIHRDNLTLYEVDELQPNQVINCKLYFWIDYYYDYPGEIFKAKIKAVGESIDVVYKEATFLPGQEFNVKIKELAGTDTSVKENKYRVIDNNILMINRVKQLPSNTTFTDANILSTDDSEVPIYGWFDNGTLYYYTFAKNPYMNENASYMFFGIQNLTDIDLDTINTNKTTNMANLFNFSNSLKKINVRNFNTKNVTTMYAMFGQNENLVELDVSSFDTSNVVEMSHMFSNCRKLNTINLKNFNTNKVKYINGMFYSFGYLSSNVSLDISNFNLHSVLDANDMFTNVRYIVRFKTPKVIPNGISINLPKTLYDSIHNAYTTLNSSSPTETWLYSEVS